MSELKTKEIVEFCFSRIFRFAEENYGIHWNTANNIFFDKVLQYGTIHRIRPTDIFDYIEYFSDHYDEYYDSKYQQIKPRSYKDIPREYIDSAADTEKAYIIFLAFIEENDIKHEMFINCDSD